WYYFILQLLREHKLNTNFSVKDILQILLEVKHVCIDDKWHPAEITKTTAKLLAKLNIKHIT
ncbi:MAG: hypothetical protein LBQ64_05880, partial [Bacteroidales bacterium]|nr:hypothetical protein [Bacteroidales bacterium]